MQSEVLALPLSPQPHPSSGVDDQQRGYALDLALGESIMVAAGTWEPHDRLRCGGYDVGVFGSSGDKHYISGDPSGAVEARVVIAVDGSATVTCEESDVPPKPIGGALVVQTQASP